MDTKDLAEMRAAFGSQGLSQYEQIKVNHMQRHPSGTAIAGLVVGVAGVVAAAGVGLWATAKASEARKTAAAENAGTAALLHRLATQYDAYMAQERQERREGDITLNQTITDTISGQQSSQLTATQQAELSQAQQLMFGLSTGEYSRNPQRVALYQDAKPCPCPQGNGCGCQYQ